MELGCHPVGNRRSLSALGSVFVALAAIVTSNQAAAETNDAGLTSTLGSYLAGRIASGAKDTEQAVQFYRHALSRAPATPRLLERAFLVEATEGHAERAIALARRLVELRPQHRLARTWLALAAFNEGKYKEADGHFQKSSAGPIGELTTSLARAWIAHKRGRNKSAMARLKGSQQAEWAQYHLRYHRAMIADLTRDRKLATKNFDRIFKSDARMPRVTITYLRHAAHAGKFSLANRILRRNREATTGPLHPAIADVARQVGLGKRLPLLVQNGTDGLAEVFYGLGEALTNEGGMQLGAIYLQMALYLKPDFPFAHAALANVYETNKHYARANAIYGKIPADSPLQELIAIRKANNLDSLEQTDEAVEVLKELSSKDAEDLRPLEALANLLRGRSRYKEAVAVYSKILDRLGKPEANHWRFWYGRGTSYERMKNWPLAEKDLLQAKELSPDQPLVLNYLGYSWVDRNERLEEGLKLIEKAVRLKPDDGYIVDSLGWAHFRLGNYAEAVKHLERAVELRPSDPILNDHFGDALWRVGRIREARFQWELSLTLEPEAEDARKTREKLRAGLPKVGAIRAVKTESDKTKSLGKRVETKVDKTKR